MAKYVLYKRENGEEIKLCLPACAAVELEARMDKSINELIRESDSFSVSREILATSMDNTIPYNDRKKIALEIFDEMVDAGKDFHNYQLLIFDTMVAAGFMKGEVAELSRKMIAVQEKSLAKLSDIKE